MAKCNKEKHLGSVVRTRRVQKGWTQKDLANVLGVHRPYISRWETGRSMPTIDALKRLCEVLELSAEELLWP